MSYTENPPNVSPVPADQHCWVCASWFPHPYLDGGHKFITVADFLREAREDDRRRGQVTHTFPNGTHSVEANYVAEYRPY